MTAETPTLHLVDASPYIFRAYYSLPSSITTPEGEPANAVYGFASFLIKLLGDAEPTHLARRLPRRGPHCGRRSRTTQESCAT